MTLVLLEREREREREREQKVIDAPFFLPVSFYLIFRRVLSDRQPTFPKPAFRLRKVIDRLVQTTLVTVTNITQKKKKKKN